MTGKMIYTEIAKKTSLLNGQREQNPFVILAIVTVPLS